MLIFRIFSFVFFLGLALHISQSAQWADGQKLIMANRIQEIHLDFPTADPAQTPPNVSIAESETVATTAGNAKDPNKPEPDKEKDRNQTIRQEQPEKTAFAIFQRKKNRPDVVEVSQYPKFYRGLYISNKTTREKLKFGKLRQDARQAGINAFIIDVQPYKIPAELLDSLRQEGFHPVARLVVFEGGLKTAQPAKEHMNRLKRHLQNACQSGFSEIQFDYIRFEDGVRVNLSIQKRYDRITGIIEELKSYMNDCNRDIQFGADIFGRVPFLQNDIIGQRVENFSESLDILYPMMYPSHFYGQPKRIKNPYQTVYDGVKQSQKRVKKGTRIIPYIQGFNMAVRPSGLKYHEYIKQQIKGSYDSESDGFVVWNAFNDYKVTFKALAEIDGKSSVADGGN